MSHDIKQAVLIGLRHQRDQLDIKITELERDLRSNGQPTPQKKRGLSAVGRKRIGEATARRWAKLRKEKKAAG